MSGDEAVVFVFVFVLLGSFVSIVFFVAGNIVLEWLKDVVDVEVNDGEW